MQPVVGEVADMTVLPSQRETFFAWLDICRLDLEWDGGCIEETLMCDWMEA